jgi:ABC-type Fe3+ transport system substrate-binding protein
MLVLTLMMMGAVPSLCSAENSGKLVLYTSVPTTQLNIITAMFTAKYPGVKIDVISARSEELMDRVLSGNGHEQGGVILGGGLEAYEAIADHLSAYESPNASAFQTNYKSKNAAYTPVQIHVSAFVVNNALAQKLGVLNEKLSGLIVFTDPNASTADRQQAAFISSFAEKLALATPSAPSFVLNSVTAGQSLVGIMNEEKALERVSRSSDLSLVYASEGVAMGASYAGILEGTPDETTARLFIDFITSKEYQQAASEQLHQRSVRTDVNFGLDGIPATGKLVMVNYKALTLELISASLGNK